MNLTSIALNNLKRRRSRVAFLLVGLALSVGMALTLTALGRGMAADIAHRLDEYGANILVVPAAEGLTLSYGGVTVHNAATEVRTMREADVERLKTIKNAANIRTVSPKLVGRTRIHDKDVLIVGIRFPDEFRLKKWWRIAEGSEPVHRNQIMVGAELARALTLRPGGTILLGEVPATVAAVLGETGDQDDGLVFADLGFTQDLLGSPGTISMVELAALCTGCPIEDMVEQISGALPGGRVKALKESLELKMQAVHQFRLFSYAVSGLMGFVAGLIVLITMMSSVGERRREIGIFRAVGYRRKHIVQIICSEAMLLGFAGGLVGAVGGAFLPRYLAPFVVHAQNTSMGFDPFAALVAVVVTTVLSGFASLYPALHASRLDPVESLREL